MRWLDRRKIALIFVGLFISGCGATVKPVVKQINTLAPGVVQTTIVGEPMFEKGMLRLVPGFVATTNYYLPEMDHLVFPTVKKGAVWVCSGTLQSGDYLCSNPEIRVENVVTDTGARFSGPLPTFIIKPWGEFHGLYYAETPARVSEQRNRLHGLFSPIEVPLQDSYKAQLIYNGKTDSTLNLTYQEFAGNMKEPAISEGLRYEITSVNMINVKNVMIEVLEATNSSIKYIFKN
jgi:hypothetical protein